MRTMRNIAIISALLVLAAGCGKDKKEDTTPELSSQPAETGPAPATAAKPAPASTENDPNAELEEIVYFEFDSSALDDQSRAKLDQNVEWLKEDPVRTLTIEGHTDEKGTSEYNVALGDRRARTAKEYIVRMGVDESRIKIISYGEERPASSQDSENRRGVFVANRK